MKQTIEALITKAITTLTIDNPPPFIVERTRDAQHGDFASNIAMVLAKVAKTNPRQLAEQIIAALPSHEAIVKV